MLEKKKYQVLESAMRYKVGTMMRFTMNTQTLTRKEAEQESMMVAASRALVRYFQMFLIYLIFCF